MEPPELADRIADFRAAAAGLVPHRPGPSGPDPPAVAALDASLEELRVAEEVLRRQGEEIQQARDALEAEHRRYQALFDAAPDPFLVTDRLGIIREANRAAAELLRIAPDFLVGKPLASFVPAEGRPAFRSELNRLGRGMDVGRYTMRLQPRRGEPFTATVAATPLGDATGVGTALLWSLRDDSLVQQAEACLRNHADELERRVVERTAELRAELKAKEEMLIRAHAAAAEASPREGPLLDLIQDLGAIIWRYDVAARRLTFINRSVETHLGFPARRWLDEPDFWAGRMHPEDRQYVEQGFTRAIAEGRGYEGEYRLIDADGRAHWFRSSARIVVDPSGRPVEFRGVLIDIGRRKKAERRLYHAKTELVTDLADLRRLHHLAGRLLATHDLDTVLQEILEAALGLQGADLEGLMLYHPESDDLTIAAQVGLSADFLASVGRLRRGEGACDQVLATGRPVMVEDVDEDASFAPFRDAAAREGFRAVYCTPLRSTEGQFLGTLATFFRVPHHPTERQVRLVERYAALAAEAFEKARLYRLAREGERRKEQFLAILAHELRGPLAALRAAADLLEVPELEADAAAHAHARTIIGRQVGQLGRLVEDLLDMARIAQGKLCLHPQRLDLARVIAQAVETVRPAVTAKGHELTVAVAADCPTVQADPTRLEQVLVNLLTNAAKYTPAGGHLQLAAACEGDEVVIRVRDDGLGLAPEVLPRVFELFSQAGPGEASPPSGLGIGLSLVKSLVEAHGGRVEAASEGPGRGCEFLVALPAAPAPSCDEATPGDAPVGDAPRPALRILVVDDQADQARLLSRLLGARGHQIAVALDAAEALDLARAGDLDAALLDLSLPDMDGLDLGRALRRLLPGVPLIALTGHDSDGLRRRTREAGFDLHLVKPLDSQALLRALADVAGQAAAEGPRHAPSPA